MQTKILQQRETVQVQYQMNASQRVPNQNDKVDVGKHLKFGNLVVRR